MGPTPGQQVLAILSGRNPSPTRAQRRAQRKAHKAEQQQRESLAIQMWLEEKAPTAAEMGHPLGMGFGTAVRENLSIMDASVLPVSLPARSVITREMVEAKIINMVVEVEPDWDVASMIDAHRNGATALDEQRKDIVIQKNSGPVFQDVSTHLWDPRHEMGPRERDWIRTQRKRASGNNHRNGR